MEPPDSFYEDDFPLIGEVLDAVKTARYQFGTIAHMSEDVEHSVAGLRSWLERLQAFFSDRRNITYTAVAIVVAAAVLNLVRGWLSTAEAQRSPFVIRLERLNRSAHRQA